MPPVVPEYSQHTRRTSIQVSREATSYMKSHPLEGSCQEAIRLPSAPDVCPWHLRCPRKPSVPCRVQSCTAYRSHGSLTGPTLTGLTAEASHNSAIRRQAICHGLRPGLIRLDGYQPTLPPASGLNPTADEISAKSFRRLKGHKVSHHVIT